MTERVIVCINLMDEARRKGIEIDEQKFSARLGGPVPKNSARNREGFDQLLATIERMAKGKIKTNPILVSYSEATEAKIEQLVPDIKKIVGSKYPARWIALRLLDGDQHLLTALRKIWS